MKQVSVIVPCYNQASFVHEAVESALASFHRELEVIVVDDGSSDDPAKALYPLIGDDRLRLLRQPNAGVAAARNTAIATANGDLFLFLDADDSIAPGMLSALVQEFVTHPGLGIAYCDITHVDASGKPVDDYSISRVRDGLDGDLLPSLLLGGYFPPVCVLVSREALTAAGDFDPVLGGCCDWDIWARIAALGFRARYVDQKLAFYRLHAGSMSHDLSHMERTMRLALQKLLRSYPERAAEAMHVLIHRNEMLFRANAKLVGDYEGLSTSLQWHQVQLASHAAALESAATQVSDLLQREQASRSEVDELLTSHRMDIERLEEAQRWYVDQQRSLQGALAQNEAAWRDAHARTEELAAAVERLVVDNAKLSEALGASQGRIRHLQQQAERQRQHRESLSSSLIGRTLMKWHLLPRFPIEKEDRT